MISGHEICGVIGDLADEFERRGHEVVTIAMGHRLFPRRYHYDQHDFPVSALSRLFGMKRLWRRIFQVLWEIDPRLHHAIEKKLRIRVVRGVSLYIRVWGKIPVDREVLVAVKGAGAGVATLLMGSDVRDYNVFRDQYGVTRWEFSQEYLSVPLVEKVQTLRIHERYADAIFSVPDQMGLALRPYHHLQVPLCLDKLVYAVPARAVPVVVHAPSVPHIKGTDVIEAALATLRQEGVAFELVSVRDAAHKELLRILTDADVLVDELIGHGPGWLSFEAMGSGCAVATRYLDSSPACFRPPVWSINEHNIVDRLRTLLTDRDLRIRLAEEGRRYVEKNNRIEHVVDGILERVEAGAMAMHDYVPTYLTTSYVPGSDAEAAAINAANTSVSHEAWYKSSVAGKRHDGLSF